MYFPLKKEPLKKFKPSMKLNAIDEVKYLKESLGGFSAQYELADKLSNAIITMLNGGFTEFETNINIDGCSTPIKVNLEVTDSLLSDMFFRISPAGKYIENKAKIEYLQMDAKLPSFIKNAYGAQEIKNKIKDKISHELMHGNIFTKRAESGVEIDDAPQNYPQIIKILETIDCGIIRDIAYAMYASYYQECQAIISSEYAQLDALIDNETKNALKSQPYEYTMQFFKRCVKMTEAYQTYAYIKQLSEKINGLNENEIRSIEQNLSTYGLTLKDGLKNEMKKTSKLANGALHDVTRNAALFFNKELNAEYNEQN